MYLSASNWLTSPRTKSARSWAADHIDLGANASQLLRCLLPRHLGHQVLVLRSAALTFPASSALMVIVSTISAPNRPI